MTGDPGTVLLVNPTITKQRNARWPLAVLSLAAALEGRYPWRILDGNVDRDFIATALRIMADRPIRAIGLTVMGGRSCDRRSRLPKPFGRGSRLCRSSGAGRSPPIVHRPP